MWVWEKLELYPCSNILKNRAFIIKHLNFYSSISVLWWRNGRKVFRGLISWHQNSLGWETCLSCGVNLTISFIILYLWAKDMSDSFVKQHANHQIQNSSPNWHLYQHITRKTNATFKKTERYYTCQSIKTLNPWMMISNSSPQTWNIVIKNINWTFWSWS